MANRAVRLGYRGGYLLARAWWAVRHPEHRGALVAIWAAGRLLLVRQSYQPWPAFPGGGVRPDEAPVEAAQRELSEELGLAPALRDLALACVTTQTWDGRRDTVTFFEWHLPAEPPLRLDRREILAAGFVAPEALPARVSWPVAHYLDELRRRGGLPPAPLRD